MADAEQTDLIAQFSGVTGVAGDRAKFYLESSAWQLEVALASFFDNDDGQGEEEVLDLPPPPAMPVQPPSQPPQAQPIAKPVAKKPKNTSSGGSSRFATIGSMMQAEESDSEDEGQAFYAGGSETSGQQILGPNRKKTTPNDIVENMFKAAKDHGAEVVEAGSSEPRQRGPTFEGTGYRLGDTEVMTAGDVFRGAQVARPKQRDLVLKLWKNGFSIDDGPLRDFKDPQNKEFLDAIHKGEVPNELVKEARGAEVSLNMEDHRNEDFVAPKKAVQAFGGAGHTLGSPAPNVQAAAAAGSASAAAGSATQASSAASVSVDPSQPTTSLQIRLSDGSRMVAKFNHTHKVSDVRAYILGSHPQMNGSNFVLMTTFPNKELSDESVTLAEAKLLNAVLVQRMK